MMTAQLDRFYNLESETFYDLIEPESGHYLIQGIQGVAAMAADWPADAQAWPAGAEDFGTRPDDVAE